MKERKRIKMVDATLTRSKQRTYFAANDVEGCGHYHLTRDGAKKCLLRLSTGRGRKRVLRHIYGVR